MAFFESITKNKFQCFGMKKSKKSSSSTVDTLNRDILSKIHAYCLSHPDKKIDYRAILAYPLCEIPLAIATTDGCPRKTAKKVFKDILLENVQAVKKPSLGTDWHRNC